jgi:hypothetical protein
MSTSSADAWTTGPHSNSGIHHIFWTAGFDSTFRLTQLLLTDERPVQPIYVIDLDRQSTLLEMRRMVQLRYEIQKLAQNPNCLLPTKPLIRDDFPIATDIQSAFTELASKTHIGSQYQWLAQIGRDLALPDGKIEMCMPRHEPPSGLQLAIFEDPHAQIPELRPGVPDTIFRYFSFPTLHLTKSEMLAASRELGFEHIVRQTWFCHNPIGGRPCGCCNPCMIAKRERQGITYATFGTQRVFMRRLGRYLTRRFARRSSRDAV